MIRKIFHYGISQALPKLIGIVSLPYITKLLSVEDYGVLSIWLLVGVFADIILSLNVERSFYRLSSSIKDSTTLETAIIQIILFWGLSVILVGSLIVFFFLPNYLYLVFIILLNGIVTTLINFYRIRLQVENKSFSFAKVGLLQSILNYSFILLAVTYISDKVFAYLLGINVANFIVLFLIFKNLNFTRLLSTNYLTKEILEYSIPLMGSAILIQIGLLLDRELIAISFAPQELGKYAVLVTIGTLITLTASVIRKVIDSEVYSNFNLGSKGLRRNNILFNLQFAASALVTTVILLFRERLGSILFSSEYLALIPISSVYFIGILLNVLEGQLNIFFHRFKAMGLMLRSNIITIIFKAILGFILIRFYGFTGIMGGVFLFPLLGGLIKLHFLKQLMLLRDHTRLLTGNLIIALFILISSMYLDRIYLIFISIGLLVYFTVTLNKSRVAT